MGSLSRDCPHCKTRKSFFGIVHQAAHPGNAKLFECLAICGHCHCGVVLVIEAKGQNTNPMSHNGALSSTFGLVAQHPTPTPVGRPEHLPSLVDRYLEQANGSLEAKSFDAAGAMYRKTLETALKLIDPATSGSLNTRIDKLADKQLLTPAIQEWAHMIRLDGNDAVHDDEPFTQEQCEQLSSFTEMALTYLYTMPKRVELRKNPPAVPTTT